MRRVLLIITRSLDPLNDIVTRAQQELPDAQAEVFDLTADAPDYDALVQRIFEADSVQVW